MEQKFSMQMTRMTPPLQCRQEEIHPSVDRDVALLQTSIRQHNPTSTQLTCLGTKYPYTKDNNKGKQLLDYCTSQEEAIITYKTSKMILNIHSDGGYLNKKKAQSRAGGHFFLSDSSDTPQNNGAIHTNASIIKEVMSLAVEAELGALYLNQRNQFINDKSHMKWDTCNLAHPYSPITQQQRV